MRFFKRLTRSVLKRTPGGKKLLNQLEIKPLLFQPASSSIYQLTGKEADAFYYPAFDRIFLLMSIFRTKGDIYEFGVLLGYTAKLFATYVKRFRFGSSLHLFDSFEGLPEFTKEDQKTYEAQSNVWTKGMMVVPSGIEKEIQKKLEKMLGSGRVHVIKGFFEKTLETYLKAKKHKKASIVNLDCDLYSSSKYVLTKLFEYEIIQDGTIVICDDWMCSRGNPNLAQRKALKDTLEEFSGWQFEPYFNYGLGSQVFVVHDMRLNEKKRVESENISCSSC